ncbi:acetyl-CoA/propionyl-CoA carboxylase carboxyl transferase subunit [Saccharothrix ecbatanensis]|uniref:Acetyl-CoA/propionyl-CoA carboxylase carboxyl transferase subunit n=1 Tax=Saccharothrix ecbatanensis TaxID=1105145 RepID=A0A7W9M2H1_9PSEU|nr:carboxyl transferase domain-containing protein [Saccharothrix ecbatanensis]MBB5804956.1 acetyl-CoA/propionyl-CoA carboxylase carboxyl transferase subunit [Saccharothrix ecbatanensis]
MTAQTVPAHVDARVVEPDFRAPSVRLGRLLDEDSAQPLHEADDSGVSAVSGLIDGRPVIAYCTDATKMGGALGWPGAMHIVRAIETAVEQLVPVIGLWHSGGAKLADGVESMDGVGRMFAAMTRASGVVPQISVVLGPAAGAAAYGPALTDIVVMSNDARIFVTGPDVVKTVTGEVIDMEGLGGPVAHGRKSGVAHIVVDTEEEAYRRTRRLTGFFSRPGEIEVASAGEPDDLSALLPESPRRAYDVHPVINRLLDDAVFEELQAGWAPNVVVGLGRLCERTVGIIANNPLRKGGCLDSLSAEKAARFVRMCDSLGVPLVVLVDVPGYLPGVGQEWGGVVRRGAKLLHAFAESSVPRITLITRKSYGGAYIAMNSRSLGATAVFAWPDAEVAVMGVEAAVGILHRKKLAAVADETERAELREKLIEEHRRIAGGVDRAMSLGVVDEVISPDETRVRIAKALANAPAGRGRHTNIPL